MKPKIFFAISLFSMFVLNQAFTQELPHEQIQPSLQKTYVSPDQVFIYPEGVFYLNETGDLSPTRMLSSDENGLYILESGFYYCPSCGRPNRDNICGKIDCPLYGK